MRTIFIALALALCALPAFAQTLEQDLDLCTSTDPDAVVKACTALIQSGRSSKPATDYYNRGIGYFRKGLYDQAIADFTQAIALKPDFAEAYNNRGFTYGRKGLYDQATTDYTQAIALKPDSAKAYNGRAWNNHVAGRDAQGLPDAEKAVSLAPTDANTIETRAEIYEKLGRHDEAVADYRAVLKIDPNEEAAKNGLTRLGVATTKTASDRIVASYNTAFCRPPRPEEMKFWRGDARSATEDALLAAHRVWLRNTPSEREAMITRSYLMEFQRSPHADELDFWESQVVEKGYTCADLLALHKAWKMKNMTGAPH
jgi:tetratricopeptide (TPR) repeat protein